MGNRLRPYQEIKREIIRGGLLSCSQVGFNIAFGPLPQLRERVAALFARIFSADEHWVVPPLLRSDWIPGGAWDNPGEEQWVRTEPLGHVLTPVPAMHLLNRLRHHPATGVFHVSGWCARLENDTLPLLRQVSFFAQERVELAESGARDPGGETVFESLLACAGKLALPVRGRRDEGGEHRFIDLVLPDTPIVPLTAFRRVPPGLLHRHGMTWAVADRVSCGLERWCLAIIAAHGAAPEDWPEIEALCV